MRLASVIRLIAAIVVFAILAGTLVVAKRYFFEENSQLEPANKLESMIPVDTASEDAVSALIAKLEVENLPDVTPGERAFESARGLLIKGDYLAAEEKLKYVNTYYPTAVSAPEARRILGEMNMDRLLLGQEFAKFETYKVKKGDSFYKIVRDHQTNLDLLMLLNGLERTDRLHPGDIFNILRLNFRVVIDLRRSEVSLWDGPRYIKGYAIKASSLAKGRGTRKTEIVAVEAQLQGRRIKLPDSRYHAAEKIIALKRPQAEIRPFKGKKEAGVVAVYLDLADMEELALLLKSSNSVEIRY